MTERLYYTDSFLTTFTARVIERAEGGRRVYLDRTAFYPTSGGQPHDLGMLGGVGVLDVVDEGERIAHLLAEPLTSATEVEGVVHWPRRLDHIQQHTAQHLLSALLEALLGAHTTSVHFGDETSTVDLDCEMMSEKQLATVERRANEIVMEDRPVTVSFEAADEVAGLRKASRRTGTLRIIAIDNLDRSACGGTHVRHTGEIGPILVLGAERVKGTARVSFVAGWRAITHARANESLLGAASSALSAPKGEVPQAIEQLAAQLRDARSTLRKLSAEVAISRARALAEGVEPDAGGVRRITLLSHDYSAEELRAISQAMGGIAGVRFVATQTEPTTIFVAAGPESGWNAGAVLKAALTDVGGRGGGSARAAQGTVSGADELERVVGKLSAVS